MKMNTPQSLMLIVLDLVNETNLVGLRLYPKGGEVFGRVSLRVPSLQPFELGFLRTVSWLYALYHEAGKWNLEFLYEQLKASGLDQDKIHYKHVESVQQLRTFLQHNLDPTKEQNRTIQYTCEHWFKAQCQVAVPTTNMHWKLCLLNLLQEVQIFLRTLQEYLRGVEQDEGRALLVQQWEDHLQRSHPPHEFDRLISIVAADMGRDKIDVVRLRKRYLDKWIKELHALSAPYLFEVEGRKLIEHVLLTEMTPVLPITGKDLIDHFALTPGPQIGELLQLARKLYMENPCSRDDLLAQLVLESPVLMSKVESTVPDEQFGVTISAQQENNEASP